MGKIIQEKHIYAGGVETEERRNELIVIMDCHDEEGYGVYMMDGYSDNTSMTTSFGYGAMAKRMAESFYQATVNYYTHVLNHYDKAFSVEYLDIEEWNDSWFKLVQKVNDIGMVLDEVDKEQSYDDGFKQMLAFIARWA